MCCIHLKYRPLEDERMGGRRGRVDEGMVYAYADLSPAPAWLTMPRAGVAGI